MHRAMQRPSRKQCLLPKQRYLATVIAYRNIGLKATCAHGQSAKSNSALPLAPNLLSLFFGLSRLSFFGPKIQLDPHCSQVSQQEPRTEVHSIDPPIDCSSRTRDSQRLQCLSQIPVAPAQANHVPLEHQISLRLKIPQCLRFSRPSLLSTSLRYGSSSFAHTLILPFSISISPIELESILAHRYLHNPTLFFNLVGISDA